MKLLLDSNVLYWSVFDREKLTAKVRELLEADQNELFVSRASLWELSAKASRGGLAMPDSSIRFLLGRVEEIGITTLPIEMSYILKSETLPYHHSDPFDRLIVAQALEEGLTILTSDSDIPRYDAPVIWR
ncbi:PIN domain nuclease, a component of toxin-antitoxin system (PIN domain) [Granulicella rosea]|uniref:PIN domain nuclease, a component of toxin-antitoxin system (PIN domain) n=1 Tax=Granulicella rosea TaxID=474952 RepID=A0A239MDW5_9BACT|nr:type II toxin-antitoxin system VapC family toxin [Granulicella rosea]SNT40382.1 PIN domain nuclease, a component of toxin-antitoxin system (PIN domain) [Granulicella rosea]